MASITVRNSPEETHRALRVRAAQNGRSTEAEVREILETAVRPKERIKVGSESAAFGDKYKLDDSKIEREQEPPRIAISEASKPGRDPAVIAWLDQQSVETSFLSATSLAELLIGIAIMPDGKRKSTISAALDSLISRSFDTRISPFDEGAAMAYSQ
ncbi:hypothetical protein OY671_009189, partial [Metschnikowia pulcherrima]